MPTTFRARHLQLSGDCLVQDMCTWSARSTHKHAGQEETPYGRQCYGEYRSPGKVNVHCMGDLRTYLHRIKAGQRPGRGDVNGWGRCSRRKAAEMQAGVGILHLQAPAHSETGAAEHQHQRQEAPAQKTQHCEAARKDQQGKMKSVLDLSSV